MLALPIIVRGAISIGQSWATSMTSGEFALQTPLNSTEPSAQLFMTQIDDGMCGEFMGDFQDQNLQNEADISLAIEEMFTMMSTTVITMADSVTNSIFDPKKDQESFLSVELKKWSWILPWSKPNNLQEDIYMLVNSPLMQNSGFN